MAALDKIKEIIRNRIDINQNVDIETKLYSLDINSIQFILLLSEFEEQFDIEIDIENVDDFKNMTIQDIISIIEETK